ncbi:hypothetical protein Fcan01_16585 [Folsomia candida]|uniref:Uncharacterized protein n=1 Tax=Folsomia candida TaxID=158441 RepID=A0A226DUH8_FOLCA|nr:hypothetical protein Fcan01_16585 [Folsomia candida]
MNVITFLALLFAPEVTSTLQFWNIPKLLDNCNLQFVSSNGDEIQLPLLARNNPNSPITLQNLNTTSTPNLKNSKKISTTKYLNIFAVVLIIDQQSDLVRIIALIVLMNEDPNYIFMKISDGNLKSQDFPRFTVTSKFFFFNGPGFYTVCIPCKFKNSLIPINPIISLNNLAKIWTLHNQNLHSNPVLTFYSQTVYNFGTTCGPNLGSYHPNATRQDCGLAVLSDAFNFTNLNRQMYDSNKTYHFATFLHMEQIADKVMIEAHFLTENADKWSILIHAIDTNRFKFVVVTKQPETFDSAKILLTPFDQGTWVGIVVAILGIVATIQFYGKDFTPVKLFGRLGDALFWAFSSLLHHTEGSRITAKVQRGWLISWYFGCIILSNLYEGELSSCLTATFPSVVPKSMVTLLNSVLPIISTSAVTRIISATGQKRISTLKEVIIPDLLSGLGNRDEILTKFLNRLQNRLFFVNNDNAEVTKNMSKSLPIHNSTKGTFAVVNLERNLKMLSQIIEFFGKQFVVKNFEVLPLQYIAPPMARRNYIYTALSQRLGWLVQSGLYERWEDLAGIHAALRHFKKLIKAEDNYSYKRFYAKITVNVKANNRISTQFKRISFKALKHLFILCAVLALIAAGFCAGEGFVKYSMRMRSLRRKRKWRRMKRRVIMVKSGFE